ncbi:MAG: AsmA-like C-terminal region-containing protein, partial [Deltaproteobacteria bacterium]
WPSFVSFSGGTIDAVYHVTGPSTDSLAARGSLEGRNLRFAISQRKRRKKYALSALSLVFNANLSKEAIDLQIPQASLLDTTLRGHISYAVAEPSSRLELSLQSPFMPLQTFKTIFPSPLVPAWIERDLFPRLSKGEVMADHFSLAGTLEQIAHLNRPENTGLLAMQLMWKDLHIPTENTPLPFASVAGRMEIKNNRLALSGLRGRFGTSAVDDASLHVTPLVGKRHRYRIILGGDFALKDLLAMRELPWTPRDIKEKAAGLEGSSGRITGRLEVVKQDPGTVRIKHGSLRFDHCTFVHDGSLFPVKVAKGTMEILESGRLQFEGEGSWGQSALAVSGFSDWSLTHLETTATGTLDIDTLTQRSFPGKHWSLQFGKPVGCTLHISRKGSLWSCGGKIDLTEKLALKVGSLHLNPLGKNGRLSFALDYTPGKELHLKNLEASFGKSFFLASVQAFFRGEQRITAQITTSGLYLEDLGVQFQGSCPIPTGVLTGTMQGFFPLGDLPSSTLTGALEANGLCLAFKKLPQPLSVSECRVAFSGDTVDIKSLHVTAGSSSLALQGHLQGWKALRGNLKVQSTHIEAGLGISFKITQVSWRKLQMGPLCGEGVLDKGALPLLRSLLKLEHGFITMQGDLTGDTQKEITFLSQIRFYEQPVQQLFRIFNREEYYIEGQLSSDILLSGQGHDKASLIASLQGEGKVLLEKGTIKKSSVLIKILDFLSIQKIFRRPPPNLSKEGFYYDKIGADFVIRNGTLFTENLLMRSPVINGAGKGSIDFSTKQTRADLGVQPLVALDSMVSKIPIVGYILTGKDKTLLVYYFKVEGPLSSPEVTYIPLKQWGNSLMGYITRIFLTPPRLFEKLMRLRKPSPNQSIQSDADDRQQNQSGDSRR